MKKVILILTMVMLLVGCTQKPVATIDRVEEIVAINYAELKEKLDSNTNFLLYIGRPDCKDCQEFYPLLEEYVNQNKKGLYYLNVKNFRDNSRKEGATEEEIDFYKNLQETLDYDWTPTLQLYVNGEKTDDFDFLSLDYYSIEEEQERKEAYDKFVADFKVWIDKHY